MSKENRLIAGGEGALLKRKFIDLMERERVFGLSSKGQASLITAWDVQLSEGMKGKVDAVQKIRQGSSSASHI